MKNLLFSLSLLCLTSCAAKTEYAALNAITKIEVHGPNSQDFPFRAKVKWITDKQRMKEIVALFNDQRADWKDAEVFAPSPMPEIMVIFYEGKKKQDVVGVAPTFMTKFGTKDGNMIKNISANASKEIYDAVGPIPMP